MIAVFVNIFKCVVYIQVTMDGIYMLTNGYSMYIYVGSKVPEDYLLPLFNVSTITDEVYMYSYLQRYAKTHYIYHALLSPYPSTSFHITIPLYIYNSYIVECIIQ